TEAGCVYLSKALSLNPSHLRELHLSWNDIGDSGVTHLCSALEKVHCALETLKLDKCGITEKGCSALASALSSKTCCLTDLDLSINDLQDSGVKKLCVGLKNPHCTLEKLRLSKCKVTHEGVTALTEALKSNPSHLKELDLLENDLEETGLNVRKACELEMHDCNITEKGCAVLSAVLPSISNLRELDLSHNNLQDSGVEILCIGLKRSHYDFKTLLYVFNQTYKSIVRRSRGSDVCKPDLDFIVLPTAGLEDTKCRLESLNLKNCGVTEAGCDFLSSALSLNPSHLRELHLSWNNIGDSGVKHLCAALEKVHCALETLKLSTCKIKTEGFGSLASVLRSNSHLRELDLGNNRPGDQGAELLSAVLQHPNCRLKTLRLIYRNIVFEKVVK
uniref:Uncharacterized protein n=1 Tax=Sinocyclocheilus rhinocerous TaxID=307959 RepID=A0A673KRP4_9TELE